MLDYNRVLYVYNVAAGAVTPSRNRGSLEALWLRASPPMPHTAGSAQIPPWFSEAAAPRSASELTSWILEQGEPN